MTYTESFGVEAPIVGLTASLQSFVRQSGPLRVREQYADCAYLRAKTTSLGICLIERLTAFSRSVTLTHAGIPIGHDSAPPPAHWTKHVGPRHVSWLSASGLSLVFRSGEAASLTAELPVTDVDASVTFFCETLEVGELVAGSTNLIQLSRQKDGFLRLVPSRVVATTPELICRIEVPNAWKLFQHLEAQGRWGEWNLTDTVGQKFFITPIGEQFRVRNHLGCILALFDRPEWIEQSAEEDAQEAS